ncbi:MAG: YegS/Rv2252/BmrU family lipid kinase [Bacteroidia bacterium]|nr:YegS/Rv2252/BmrU family lipid kinase [Bacteroidia bacterium]
MQQETHTNFKRKFLFIVNPNAGKKISGNLIEIIRNKIPKEIEYQIEIWKSKEHFKEILNLLQKNNFTDAIAVGGDGTVNQVAKSVIGTNIALGIVPAGSGNGLARTLGLSMKTEEVIKQIAEGNTKQIDYGTVNNIPFFCTSGIGFDAHIGNLFATSKKRGLQSYIKITVGELLRYKSQEYILKFNNQEIKRKAYLITVANAGQYGNDFYIAPQAKINDGKFHLVILKPFGFFGAINVLIKVLKGRAFESKYIETYVCDSVTILRNNEGPVHFDGEPEMQGKQVEFICNPTKLNVIVGKSKAFI